MEFAALFFIEILALFFLSRELTRVVHATIMDMFRNDSLAVFLLASLLLPGVVIHELAHFLMAKILRVHTGRIELFPKREGNSVKLGSVMVARTHMVNEFLIGVAPMIVGILLILGIVSFALTYSASYPVPLITLTAYGVFVISNTMYSSRRDALSALPFFLTVLVVIILFVLFGIRLPNVSTSWMPQVDLSALFYRAVLYLSIPIMIDMVIILILRILRRLW